MTDVQMPMPPPSPSSRISRGRLLRVLTLGKPQESKRVRKGKEEPVKEEAVPVKDEPNNASTPRLPQERVRAPMSSLDADDENPPTLMRAEESRSPDSDASPPTPADATAAANASPTLFKRFTTRLRSLSRPKEPGFALIREDDVPPVPSVPAATEARSKSIAQRAKRATLFAGLTKSTPSLVSPVSPSEEAAPAVPQISVNTPANITRRSSAPKLTFSTPTVPALRNRPNDSSNSPVTGSIDAASVPLPISPLEAPFSGEPLSISQSDRSTIKPDPPKALRKAEPPSRPGTAPDRPPPSAFASPHVTIPRSRSPSKFFVGDESDNEDGPMSAPAGKRVSAIPPGTAQAMSRPRSATYDSSPPAAGKGSPRSRAAAAGGPDGKAQSRPKTMFTGWRKSVHADTPSSPTSHTRNSSSSAGSVSSYEGQLYGGQNKRATMVVPRGTPAMHTGGFAKEEERIEDPESRRLTENAFM